MWPQVRAAKLLSQLYVQRSQFDAAAAVQEALASRASGDGATEAVTLSQRLECMEDAVLQAPSIPPNLLPAVSLSRRPECMEDAVLQAPSPSLPLPTCCQLC